MQTSQRVAQTAKGGENVEFQEYLLEVAKQKELHPGWRMGQTYFNVLYQVAPGLADSIRGRYLDPFFSDSSIGAFLNHICQEWDVIEWP